MLMATQRLTLGSIYTSPEMSLVKQTDSQRSGLGLPTASASCPPALGGLGLLLRGHPDLDNLRHAAAAAVMGLPATQ